MSLYCVNVLRDSEEPFITHYEFEHEPKREEVLSKVMQEDFGYDDNYGKIEFWKVN